MQATETLTASWDGGACPFAAGWRKTMMWTFIITDGLLFAGFLASYGFSRLTSNNWPDVAEIFHLSFIALMTFILITSSATMATAVAAAMAGAMARAKTFLFLTALGGLAFLGCQAYEWTTLIQQGARLWENPWGAALFGGYFFLVTGFHGTHVLIGVILLLVTAVRCGRGHTDASGVELVGLYWHFVDLVWVFIFTCFYLF